MSREIDLHGCWCPEEEKTPGIVCPRCCGLSEVRDPVLINLWYPGVEGPNEPKKNPATIQIGLMHVRAADDIRVTYDFERDGWSILQARYYDEGDGAGNDDPMDWQEVAFVKAWGRMVEAHTPEWEAWWTKTYGDK